MERQDLLHSWQRYYNMEPRADSRLTQRYVAGEVDWPVDMVARELVATEFLYKETLYGELIEDFLRGVAARLRREHGLSWTATWNIVKFYGPVALKLMCLDASGLRIPPALPPPVSKCEDE
jgi:hypothetical protein